MVWQQRHMPENRQSSSPIQMGEEYQNQGNGAMMSTEKNPNHLAVIDLTPVFGVRNVRHAYLLNTEDGDIAQRFADNIIPSRRYTLCCQEDLGNLFLPGILMETKTVAISPDGFTIVDNYPRDAGFDGT